MATTCSELYSKLKPAIILLILMILFPIISDAQADTSVSKQKIFFPGIDLRLNYLRKQQLLVTPDLSVLAGHRLQLYAGPVFIIPMNDITIDNNRSYHSGVSFLLSRKGHQLFNPHISLEYSRLNYTFTTILYDYAVPKIPIKATIIQEHRSFGFTPNLGLNFWLNNRRKLYTTVDAGIRMIFYKEYQTGSNPPEERLVGLNYSLSIVTGLIF